jgi:hypothetical protein
MAKVFGGGKGNCGDGGVIRSIPTSRDAVSSQDTQTYSSQPNVYSKPRAGVDGFDQRDYYNKADINKFLRLKADITSVYLKAEVDEKLSDLETSFNTSLLDYVTKTKLTEDLNSLESSLKSFVADNYYNKTNLYTKIEIDEKVSALSITDGFIKAEPTLQSEAFIDAGDADVIALKLKASTSTNITDVQTWIDHENNTIGRVLKSGQVDFYGNMRLGENIPDWKPALDVNERRIGGVADPMDRLDAINKKYMEDYITEVIDNVVQGDDKNYIVDALVY